mgnify:FL=1
MDKTIVIGLTGPTGAGKSTVAQAMLERGCALVDCDRVAREVTDSCEPCLHELSQEFGDDILRDGRLDRRLLASRAFSSPEKSLRLNEITHPWICRKSVEKIELFRQAGVPAVLLDAPLLFEARMEGICDFVVAVTAPARVRLERILARDGISRELALSRIRAQHSARYYRQRSDFWIDGAAGIESVRSRAGEILSQILRSDNGDTHEG